MVQKLEIKMVWRNPKELKFDPNQPRKSFDVKTIENIAKTYDAQEIINEPEIDENDMIITGELRVRGAIKKGLSKIKCKVLVGLSKEDRFERQVIENLHHNTLSDKDKENAIRKLWKSGKYASETELANAIGMKRPWIHFVLQLKDIRKRLGTENVQSLSLETLRIIQTIPIEEQRKIIQKIEVNQLKQGQELREFVVEIKKLTPDLKKAVLTIENPIDLETAKIIGEFPEEGQREEMLHQTIRFDKKIKIFKTEYLKYHLDIVKGKIPKKRIYEDLITKKMRFMGKMRLSILSRFSRKYIENIGSQEYTEIAITIMKELYEHLKRELGLLNEIAPRKVIEIKEMDS